LGNHGIHALDRLRWLLNLDARFFPAAAFAAAALWQRPVDVESMAIAVSFVFAEDNAVGQIHFDGDTGSSHGSLLGMDATSGKLRIVYPARSSRGGTGFVGVFA
jgi:hypothetical protein